MDVIEAVNKRRSIRAFKSDPVPEAILKRIVEAALHAPSASNSQPWELAVVSGAKMAEIKKAVAENSGRPSVDMPGAIQYPEPYASRRAAVMAGALEKLGIPREDKEARAKWGMQGANVWGAPSCIYIMIDRAFLYVNNEINIWPAFDCGAITQTILLLATEQGLGTIPAVQPVLYPDIIREKLNLPASKLFVVAIPIGYPDRDHPVNELRTTREPLDKMVTFY
ncbi:MAG: nitroreductase [Deltaproteobacteria bacterium]|nr:nitroreductase [Deltaproteobacteria bacterium]